MSLPSPTPVTRVRDLPDLLGIVPHLLGFHPSESLVVLVVVDGRVELTARADLAALQPAAQLESLLGRLTRRWPSAGMWLIGYAAHEQAAWPLLERAARQLRHHLEGEVLCVSGAEFRIGDPGGPTGRYDPACTSSAAAATWHGLQARPSRESLASALQARPEDAGAAERAWVAAQLRASELPSAQWPAQMDAALAAAKTDLPGLDRADLAWLALLAQRGDCRLRAMLAVHAGAAQHDVAVWTAVVRACPYGTQQHPLSLLGLAAWVSGDGALQSVCLEELDRQGAHLQLQRFLAHVNDAIVPPSAWPDLRPLLVEAGDALVPRRPRRLRRRRR